MNGMKRARDRCHWVQAISRGQRYPAEAGYGYNIRFACNWLFLSAVSPMLLGIKPTVDFAFKKIFGSPENSLALIGLLNAILNFARPIVSVEIRNPFSFQEFAQSKLIVLDVRCRDSAGRLLNVEMQVSAYGGLVERLVYYACSMYVDQISAGINYATAAPSISICLLNHRLFSDIAQTHHRFQMIDQESGRQLNDAIEVHTVELPKYNLDEQTISSAGKLEQCVFLLLHAQDYDAKTLRRLLSGIEFELAIETIEIISAKTEDKQMYDQREQAQRDYEWALSGAREEGRKLAVSDTVRLLQDLLGEPPTAKTELTTQSLDALTAQVAALQQRLRDRQA